MALSMLVFGFMIGRLEPHATALPRTGTDLLGGGGLLGHSDGGCEFVLGGSRGRARMGAQDPDEVPICVIHFGRLRGGQGTAVVAYSHAV